MQKRFLAGAAAAALILMGAGCARSEQAGQQEVEPVEFRAVITNVSEGPVSPGVYAVHGADFNLNWIGQEAPLELEPLAEVGEPVNLQEYLQGRDGVVEVIKAKKILEPGETEELEFEVPADRLSELFLSGYQMYVPSNDGIVFFDRISLADGGQRVGTNLDAGTEENTDLGSGFEGGQPDPSKGDDNVDNGTATEPRDSMKAHPQINFPVLQIDVIRK